MSGTSDSTGRLDYIDWLRVLAVLVLIPFHTARIFNYEDFYVKNEQLSVTAELFITFVSRWHMPIFFLVSGAATWFALARRSTGQYIIERFQRLLVPLIFGSCVIVVPQVYYMRLGNRAYGHLQNYEFDGSFLSFYPDYFNGIAPEGNWEWGHLWFLAYLFTFSLLALPLFLAVRRGKGQTLLARLATICEKRGGILVLGIPLAVTEAVLRPNWPGFQNLYDDWANFLFYLIYFIYGFFLCSNQGFNRAIEKNGRLALALGIWLMAAYLGLVFTDNAPPKGYSPAFMSLMAARGFTSWCWVVAILALGRRYLDFSNSILAYSNQAVLPFYVLHQTVIVVIGYYMVTWNMGVGGKFLLISAASLLACVAIYDLCIKRVNIIRALFGMRPKSRRLSHASG